MTKGHTSTQEQLHQLGQLEQLIDDRKRLFVK
jgi:hypothetical protein